MVKQKRRLPWVLMFLGAVMALGALGMLSRTPNVLQYCVAAPEIGEKGENLRALATAARKLGDSMKETVAWTALGGSNGKVSVSAGSETVDVNLVAMGEGWLEVYPRFVTAGRRIGESELENGSRVAMLDERLAFRLFGNELPEGALVKVNGADYLVVGTVRHGGSTFGGRGVGDIVEYDVYVPLLAAAVDGVPMEFLTLSAVPQGGAGAALLFEEGADQWLSGGQLINLDKEAMRRTILPRVLLLIVGMYAMVGLFKRVTGIVTGWFEGFRRALEREYFSKLIGKLLGIIGMTLLAYGALIGATYLLLVFSAQPLYVFTEWVPENIVEWSSISKVFWSLTSAAAGLVRYGSRELRIVEFWGGVLRWGVIALLLGAALLPKATRGKK